METLKRQIQQRYGSIARQAARTPGTCCGGGNACQGDVAGSHGLYPEADRETLPPEALRASLGCGNPSALAELRPGEVVLDLGSGGGIDVLLSARRVGPTGKVYGLDMTDDMLALARENQRKAGATNVEFLKGDIDHIPLPDASVDVVISNCVINLAPDKDDVFREAFRALKPGGRIAVSDIIARGRISEEVRQDPDAWIGCVAGALEEGDYRRRLTTAGFRNVVVEPWDGSVMAEGSVTSVFIRASKP